MEDVLIHNGDRAMIHRRRKGLTLEEMSRVIPGMNPHKLSEIERGLRECSSELLVEIYTRK